MLAIVTELGIDALRQVVPEKAIIRMGAIALLEAAGFEVVEAKDADAAIRILERRPDIRLVLTDIDMPRTMDGLKLSHFIRDRWPPVKLILASGKAILDEASLPEGNRFFSKPHVERSISETIVEMLRG